MTNDTSDRIAELANAQLGGHAMRILWPFLIALVLAASATAQERQPTFQSYEVSVWSGVLKTPTSTQLRADNLYQFRARIREAMGQPINFAGRYTVVVWGCGSGCQYGAVINRVTGAAQRLPMPAMTGYEFRADSQLLVVNPDGTVFGEGPTWYQITGGRFLQLD